MATRRNVDEVMVRAAAHARKEDNLEFRNFEVIAIAGHILESSCKHPEGLQQPDCLVGRERERERDLDECKYELELNWRSFPRWCSHAPSVRDVVACAEIYASAVNAQIESPIAIKDALCAVFLDSLAGLTTYRSDRSFFFSKMSPIHDFSSRLYLINDILSNCVQKAIRDASLYRSHFEAIFEKIFVALGKTYQSIPSRIKMDQFKQRVMNVFRHFDDVALYPTEKLIINQNIFLGLVEYGKEKSEEKEPEDDDEEEEDLDGMPLDERDQKKVSLSDDEDDIDGVPLEEVAGLSTSAKEMPRKFEPEENGEEVKQMKQEKDRSNQSKELARNIWKDGHKMITVMMMVNPPGQEVSSSASRELENAFRRMVIGMDRTP
ncbi:hypothetical protein CRE_06960 [Caenorhabditis remanei]|uniref:CID domain-containing protein n=1 Tax=Caenorhabditis remanei TaxID=31234 RepID=E3N6M5_CAERE|nr:hypothetical protein CRE_06960 [Caenorhabditis remanei]